MAGLRVLIIFLVMVFLLQRKMNVGYVMVIGSLLFGIFYMLSPILILDTALQSLLQKTTIELMLVLILITALEHVLRVSELMPKMIRGLRGLISDSRIVMAFLPALLGLLPSPGGARFSAPMVGEVAKQIDSMSPEEKSVVNYWFRHIWEYIFPLYPGLILATAYIEKGFGDVFKHNFPFTLVATVVGFFYCFRNLEEKELKTLYTGPRDSLWKNFLSGLFPVLLVIILTLFLNINIVLSLSIVVSMVIVWKRIPNKEIINLFKNALSPNLIILVFGVMFFRNMMETSGGFAEVINLIESSGIATWFVVAAIPFATGILTGMVLPMVSISFPIVIGFIGSGAGVDWGLFSLAFAFGFSGCMLSPLHLCFLLTLEHFEADFNKAYKMLLLPQGILMLLAYGLYRFYSFIY